MRLDLFLKASRIIIRRSLAQKFCEAGLVTVNGFDARSSKEVKAGDVIIIKKGDIKTTYQIEKLPESKQVAKSDADSLYKLISQESSEQ